MPDRTRMSRQQAPDIVAALASEPTLGDALRVVLTAVSRTSALRWQAVQVTAAQVVGHPELCAGVTRELLSMLDTQSFAAGASVLAVEGRTLVTQQDATGH